MHFCILDLRSTSDRQIVHQSVVIEPTALALDA
jgi:hypothetical protein